jgi:acyl carrier protein
MLDLEDKFNVSIDDSKVPKLPTVRDIVDILEGLVNAKA